MQLGRGYLFFVSDHVPANPYKENVGKTKLLIRSQSLGRLAASQKCFTKLSLNDRFNGFLNGII
jgi:hypothetical protein